MKYRIGIDIGGTNIRVGKVNEYGEVVELKTNKSYGTTGEIDIVETLFKMLDEFDFTDILGIGVGVAGEVDSINKTLGEAANIINTNGLPLGQMLIDRYHINVELDNDANVAGLAEAIYGNGKGKKVVYYITHSTGIGAALVINGEVLKGACNDCGEIGSYVIDCKPKRRMEVSNAGPAIYQRAKEKLGDKVTCTKDVFDLYKENNEIATEIIDQTFMEFAMMLANITFIVNPDCFIIGGGVSKNFELYYPILKKYYDFYTWGELRDIPILTTSLDEPGVVGAACLIK